MRVIGNLLLCTLSSIPKMSLTKIKLLAKDSLIYGISGVLSRLIVVLLVPLYTRIFVPADYAVINLINSTFILIGIVSVCALDSAAGRWYFDSQETDDRKTTIASWFWVQLIFSIFLGLVLMISMPAFASHVIGVEAKQLTPIWVLACLTLITNILPSIITTWYRLNRKPAATMLFTICQSLFTIISTIVFVVVLKLHLTGVYLALFLSSLLFSIVSLIQIHSWLNIRFFNKERISEMLKFSLPMLPASLAFWLMNYAGVYFLQFLNVDADQIGLYGVGAMIAAAISLVTGAFQQAWAPFAFSILDQPNAPKIYANVFLVFGIGTSFLVLSMFLFSPELLKVFTTAKYFDAAWVASILSINAVLIAFTNIASVGTSIKKNSTYYSAGVVLGAAATVIFFFLFIPVLGKEGAAISTVLAQLIVPVYLFSRAQKLYYIPYQFSHVALFHIMAVTIGVVVRFIQIHDILEAVLVKALLLLTFLSLVIFYFKIIVRVPLSIKLLRTTS